MKSTPTPTTINGFDAPNHTQTPNLLFDELLPLITSLSELKITLAIIRKTFGWHKQEDQLSFSQLEKLTGLSREHVSKGIKLGLQRGSITRRKVGQDFFYSLKVVTNSDQSENTTSHQFRPEVVTNSDQLLVTNSDPQKKLLNKRNKPLGDEPPKTKLAGQFHITDKHRDWAKVNAPRVDLVTETANFLDHHKARGNKFKDWDAAWRTWMRNAAGRFAPRTAPSELNRGGRGFVH